MTHFHFRRQSSNARMLALLARPHFHAAAASLLAANKPCRKMTVAKRTGLVAISMRQLALGAAALALLAASTGASAQSYTFTLLDNLGQRYGGIYGDAYGINNVGQVVGWSETPAWYSDTVFAAATLWNRTTPTNLGTLGGVYSAAYGINNVGQVVGYSQTTPGGDVHAVLWNGTNPTDLGTLGGGGSAATSINNAGQVVGYSHTPGNESWHAALWSGTTGSLRVK